MRLPGNLQLTQNTPAAGGLMSYGARRFGAPIVRRAYIQDAFSRVKSRLICRSCNPPSCEFIINLTTARSARPEDEVSPKLLALADEVIE